MSGKPTSQSKNSVKHPIVPSVAHVVYNEHELPAQKAIGKTKSAFKAKDLDITRNHMMQDWSIYKRRIAFDGNYEDDDDDSDDGYHHDERWASDGYGTTGGQDDDEEAEEEQEQQGEEESREPAAGSWGRDRARSEIVLPIESLLTMRKRKVAAKANAIRHKQLPLTVVGDVSGAETALDDDAAADVLSDEFESWWGLGFYDEEEVQDEWFLISEAESFMAG